MNKLKTLRQFFAPLSGVLNEGLSVKSKTLISQFLGRQSHALTFFSCTPENHEVFERVCQRIELRGKPIFADRRVPFTAFECDGAKLVILRGQVGGIVLRNQDNFLFSRLLSEGSGAYAPNDYGVFERAVEDFQRFVSDGIGTEGVRYRVFNSPDYKNGMFIGSVTLFYDGDSADGVQNLLNKMIVSEGGTFLRLVGDAYYYEIYDSHFLIKREIAEDYVVFNFHLG